MIAGRGPLHDVVPAEPRGRWTTGLSGGVLVAALAVSLMPGASTVVGIGVGVLGVAAVAAVLGPPAARAVVRNPSLLLMAVLTGLVAWWLVSGLRHAMWQPPLWGLSAEQVPYDRMWLGGTGWPWRLGRISVLPLAFSLGCAAGGLVLLADGVRAQLGLTTTRWVPWRLMTTPRERRARLAWRTVPGIVLIGVAAFLGIGLADQYVAGDPLGQASVLLVIGVWAVALCGSPFLVGSLMRVDRDQAGRAREEERQRFAAHLHDSVLQTLALVQRQAHDPAAVIRLARRQEHALRAWMAGEAELAGDTLAAALREVIAEVEDEYGVVVELTAIGDRALDRRGESVVAAAREALRNAARHGAGAPVLVFAEIGRSKLEVFIRDEGPGFDVDAVPSERRGIRDAIIGRMAVAGGQATIESTLGEGTEVVLALGERSAGR